MRKQILIGILVVLGLAFLNQQIYADQSQFSIFDDDPVSWTKHFIDNNLVGVRRVLASDLNNDGQDEIVAAGFTGPGNGLIRIYTLTGYNQWDIDEIAFEGVIDIYCEDINNDGFPDMAAASYNRDTIGIWINNNGNINQNPDVFIGGFDGPFSVCLKDVDNDGYADLISCAQDADDIAFWLYADGFAVKYTVSYDFQGPVCVTAGDIDGDGDNDIVATAYYGNKVSIFYNEGSNRFNEVLLIADYTGAYYATIANIDPDTSNSLDIVTCAKDAGIITCWFNNGHGGFTQETLTSDFLGANCLHVDNMNCPDDQTVKIFATSAYRHELAYWSQGGVKTTVDNNFRGAYSVCTTNLPDADCPGDTDMDIVGAAFIANDICWWENDCWEASVELTCNVDCLTPVVPRHGGFIMWELWIENIGCPPAGNIWFTRQPMIGGCDDYNYYHDWDQPVYCMSNLAPGETFHNYYYMQVWNIPNHIYDAAIEIGVSTEQYPESFLTTCCFEFTFADPGGPQRSGFGTWGETMLGLPDMDDILPTQTTLHESYPNPFNAVTTISFGIAAPGQTNLTVYNLKGQKIDVLVNDYLEAGNYTFEWDASKYSSGVYFYKLETNDLISTKKMSLIK
ncbi:MAG: T9SS type A sorting domain-containing protein [candidate division Zixibacteria bacterium]|nr:T9SS type A sorting domain-containing protein [candidate division Zixibacteria bacterium]